MVKRRGFFNLLFLRGKSFFKCGTFFIAFGGLLFLSPMSNNVIVDLEEAWTFSGENAGDYCGRALSLAGDVNGDGYDDVIVGADGYNSRAGKVYLFLGSSSGLSDAPVSWNVQGENANDYYGYSVSTAGDVNGDGYDDVVVGAQGYISGANTGKVYLYFGNASGLSSVPSWTKVGENVDNYYGGSVSTAGDVNGDGYDDVIIGAFRHNSRTGKAYFYLGSASGLSDTASWTKTGENNNDYYGNRVSTAGDVNGDGYDDVIVGAFGYNSGASNGKAYLYFGSTSGLSSTASWTKDGESNIDYYYISTAGDVNGDGYDDVIVGASGYNSGASNGKAYLYFGSTSGLSSIASWTEIGEDTNNYFGNSVSLGDVNGDGYSDIIVGALGYGPGLAGKAYLYSNQAEFSININSGVIYTNSQNVVVVSSVYNGSAQMIFSENADFSGASWESYVSSKSLILSSGDGAKTVYARFRDSNLAESKTVYDSIILDMTAPLVSASLPGGTYSSDQEVVIEASDSGSGVVGIYYTIDGSDPSVSSTQYVEPIVLSNTTTLKFFAVDNVGNSSDIHTEKYVIYALFDKKIKLKDVVLKKTYWDEQKNVGIRFYKIPRKRICRNKNLYIKLKRKKKKRLKIFSKRKTYPGYLLLFSNVKTVKKFKFRILLGYSQKKLRRADLNEKKLRLYFKNRKKSWRGPFRVYQNRKNNILKFKVRNYKVKKSDEEKKKKTKKKKGIGRNFAPTFYFRTLKKIKFVIGEKSALKEEKEEEKEEEEEEEKDYGDDFFGEVRGDEF